MAAKRRGGLVKQGVIMWVKLLKNEPQPPLIMYTSACLEIPKGFAAAAAASQPASQVDGGENCG